MGLITPPPHVTWHARACSGCAKRSCTCVFVSHADPRKVVFPPGSASAVTSADLLSPSASLVLPPEGSGGGNLRVTSYTVSRRVVGVVAEDVSVSR